MEPLNTHLLPVPVAKSTTLSINAYPFPIFRTASLAHGEPDANWKCFEGFLQEDCVLVRDEESIKALYNQGFFGKGTLSKNAPKVCQKKKNKDVEKSTNSNTAEIETSPKSKRRKLDSDDIEIIDSDEDEKEKKIVKVEEEEDIEVVLSDSNSENEDSLIKEKESSKQEVSVEEECLQLQFEEAYFLSYGLGCLVVKDNKNEPLDLARLWTKFCDARTDGNFPVMYTAYHHFRSKGWIVKPGIKYGVDYVLYKKGPPFYHSTYSVLVRPVKEQNLRDLRNPRNLTWSSLAAINRLNSSTGKALMFLYVIKPSTISENKISTPFCIPQFKVEEVLFQRWVPSEHRGNFEKIPSERRENSGKISSEHKGNSEKIPLEHRKNSEKISIEQKGSSEKISSENPENVSQSSPK